MAAGDDELLDPSEIENMLADSAPTDDAKPADDAGESPSAATPSPPGNGDEGGLLDAGDIEALLRQSSGDSPDQLLDKAASGVAAALDDGPSPSGLGSPTAFQFEEFGGGGRTPPAPAAIESLQDVELDLRIELGRTELLIEEVLELKPGSVVPLDKLAGDPVDVLVNGRLVARGEVLVLNDNFCVRIAEILTPEV